MLLHILKRCIIFASYYKQHSWSSTKSVLFFKRYQLIPPFILGTKYCLQAATPSGNDGYSSDDRKLFQAIVYGQNDRLKRAVKILIDSGADPNLGDEYVNLSTTSSAKRVNPMTVYKCREDEFFNHLSITNSFYGFTALHYAALVDDADIIQTLLSAGADPLLENKVGHRASAYALTDAQKVLLDAEQKAESEQKKKIREEKRKFPIEKRLSENIVGQKAAIDAVSAVIRRKEGGWCSEDKPLVLLFLGSSGVGKTELAKQMAKYLEDSNKHSNFVRIDMSEYQEKHEVSKFIGAPPGYVGFQEGGQLTEALLKNPQAVVLLDEADKAHPDVLTIMLQLFDEGRLTDGKGKTIDGSKAVYVMTCNLGNSEIANYAMKQRAQQGKDDVDISRIFKESVIKPILKKTFKRDEFLGRINEVVYFMPFSKDEIRQLVLKELTFWANVAKTRHGISIEWDMDTVDVISASYDVTYGARSLKHEVDRRIISMVAKAHEEGFIDSGSHVRISVDTSLGDCNKDGQPPKIIIQKVNKGLLGKVTLEKIAVDSPKANK